MEPQPIQCLAAVAWRPKERLSIETIDVMPPEAGEVRIRLQATGVCHRDAYTLSGADPHALFPCILGHEGSGIVESIGEGVRTLKVGDHVIPLYVPECGDCSMCCSGKTNVCLKIISTQNKGFMPDGTSRFYKDGQPIFHYMGCSTFSEYTVMPEISAAKINKKAPLDQVCLLGGSVTKGMGSVLNVAKVNEGSTVAIFGLGSVGLSAIIGARLAKCKQIIAIDVDIEKYQLAHKLGATLCLNPNDYEKPIPQMIVDMTNGGVDYSFECSGDVNRMREALECCHQGWGESVIADAFDTSEYVATAPVQLAAGRVWRGAVFGGVKGRSQLPGMVDDYLKGNFDFKDLMTHTFKLSQINEAFELMKRDEGISSIVYFE